MGTVAAEQVTGEAQLYAQHSDLVYRYCLRMLGSREEAEDATQTTFFQALRALRRGVEPRFEQAWLLTIARNECKTRHRAGSRRRRRELAHDPQTLAELAGAPEAGDGRLEGVHEALARLPETQRRALLLREWQGRSYAEIARELGVSRPAVEALIFRARRGLVRELGETPATRRHALDLASLLGAVKSLLGGGAAVKVAVGVAAVVTVGTVVASNGEGRPSIVRARDVQSVERPTSKPGRVAPAVASADRSATPKAELRRAGSTPGTAVAERPTNRPETSAPSAPAPAAEQAAPQAPGVPSPAAPTPPVAPLEAPAVPAMPPAPAPPAPLPRVELPPPPPLPVPDAPALPAVPPAPPLPDVPELPAVPELPTVPDIPILP